jgi:hypothetical protein
MGASQGRADCFHVETVSAQQEAPLGVFGHYDVTTLLLENGAAG